MIEEVKDLIEDVKDKVGDKGFTIIVAGLIGVGAFLVYRSFSSGSSEYYAPTSVTGYPTVEENADVVMESVNSTIEDSYNSMSGMMDSRLEYIEGVLDNLQTDIDNKTEAIIQNSNQNTSSVIQNSNQNTSSIIQNSNQNTQQVIQNSNQNKQEVTQVVKEVASVKSKVDNAENTTQTYTAPKTTTTTSTAKTTTTSTPKQETYTYTTKAGLNTSTSIVDALKATGADSSFSSRKAIAEANGISNYTGSYSQNVTLLNKMKSGDLVKA